MTLVPDRELADAMAEIVLERLQTEGIPLNAFARRVGVPQPTLYKHLRGQGQVPIDEWDAIARELGETLDSLVKAARKRV